MDFLEFLGIIFFICVIVVALYYTKSNKHDPLNQDIALNYAKEVQAQLNLATKDIERLKNLESYNVKNVEILDTLKLVRGELTAIRSEIHASESRINSVMDSEKKFTEMRFKFQQDQIDKINESLKPLPASQVSAPSSRKKVSVLKGRA